MAKEPAGRGSAKKPTEPDTKGKVKATKDKPNALQQKMSPSPELAAVVGKDDLARGEAVSRIWDYIRKEKLQDPKDGRNILADDKLQKVFGKKQVTMFEMNKHLTAHLKKADA